MFFGVLTKCYTIAPTFVCLRFDEISRSRTHFILLEILRLVCFRVVHRSASSAFLCIVSHLNALCSYFSAKCSHKHNPIQLNAWWYKCSYVQKFCCPLACFSFAWTANTFSNIIALRLHLHGFVSVTWIILDI